MSETSEPPKPIVDLRAKIASIIDSSTDMIRDSVAQYLADVEIKKRKDLIVLGLTKLTDAEAELAKITPDHLTFGDDGKVAQRLWTAGQKGKRDKQRGIVDRWTEAVTLAIQAADFKKLTDLSRGGGNTSDNKAE